MITALSNIQNFSLALKSKVRDYLQLSKLRLNLLVVFSALFGFLLGSESWNWSDLFFIGLGGFLVTACANTFNQVLESEYDALMKRTATRPLPAGRMQSTEAIIFAFVTGIAGLIILHISFGIIPMLLGIISILSYAFVYTPMKRKSPFSVMVGAFPGALPPLIGWAAATGTLGAGGWMLFLIQFLWQFPHFWAIGWLAADDYKKAGYKMLPEAGEGRGRSTAALILIYAAFLLPVAFLPVMLGITGWIAVAVLATAAIFYALPAFLLWKKLSMKQAKYVLYASFLYLPVAQIAILTDKL